MLKRSHSISIPLICSKDALHVLFSDVE